MDRLAVLAFILVFSYLLCCGLAAYVAKQKNRSALGWFVGRLALTPLIGLVGLCAVPALPKAAAVGPARPNAKGAAALFTRTRTWTVTLLGVFCLSATAAVLMTLLNRDAGLLGMDRPAVEAKLGRAVLVDVNVEPAVTFYCVTGTYGPVTYDHDGHWLHGARTALGGNSIGPCGKHAENLAVMYGATDQVIAAGYLTVHGHTYDRGWSHFLDRLILGRRERELFRGATAVDIPGVTVEEGPHAMRLTTGETSVVFETVGDAATVGRMAIVLFADQHDVKKDWLRLLSDPAIWGR